MTSKQKSGILLITIGFYFFFTSYFPDYARFLKPFFSWEMVLIVIGLYLVIGAVKVRRK